MTSRILAASSEPARHHPLQPPHTLTDTTPQASNVPQVLAPQRIPRWRHREQLPSRAVAPVRSWLLDDGSLTQRLIDTGGEFSLTRLAQYWGLPSLSERQLLAMGPRERALIRQVVLRLDGRPVVFARSIFPSRSLQGRLLRLRRLANQSLGTFLFAQAGMRRSPFELALLRGDSPYLPREVQQQAPAWARRSCFRVYGKALLVSEVFLENFPDWQAVLPLHRSHRGQESAAIGRAKQ